MSEYIITKRTECERCLGGLRRGMEHGCDACEGLRVVEYPVDADEWLLSRLTKLRWGAEIESNISAYHKMENPRFEGDEG